MTPNRTAAKAAIRPEVKVGTRPVARATAGEAMPNSAAIARKPRIFMRSPGAPEPRPREQDEVGRPSVTGATYFDVFGVSRRVGIRCASLTPCLVGPKGRTMEGEEFERHRPMLMGIAYRLLASSAEAEDAVQDTWLRCQSTGATIVDARAWLTTTLVRICIDRLKSARTRRETYPGIWLPEPVLTPTPRDIQSIQLGFLLLLERLDPKERAVLLLHEVFDYSHAEIAEVLAISEVGSRQALRRAKKHVAENKPRFEATRESHERLLLAFLAAVSQGSVDAISKVIAEDVVLYGDHGERTRGVILRPIVGRSKVARFFASQIAKMPASHGLDVEITDVNGRPAIVGRRGTTVAFVIDVETDGAAITTIRSVLNPKKLALLEVN